VCIAPFLPDAAQKIWLQLGNEGSVWDKSWQVQEVKAGQKLNNVEILVEKIDEKLINDYEKKFAGKDKVKNSEIKPAGNEPFESLDLRVAEIIEVEDHPGADKLYKLKINLGQEIGHRQLIAGLKEYYTKEELTGMKVVVITNLEKAKIRGVESQGMLLTADDGSNVKILSPGEGMIGEDVIAGEIKKKPADSVKFKDFLKFVMTSDEGGRILYKGRALKTSRGEITVPGVRKGARVR